MSSTPSSRRRGHSSRNSQSSTPTQQPQTTPRSTRQAPNSNAVPSSSPLFFQSSPARQTPAPPSQLANDGMIISSPPRNSSDVGDREETPRPATRPIEESSPVRYDPSSSPVRNVNRIDSDIPSSSSGLFVRQDGPTRLDSRRGDIHSDTFDGPSARRRRVLVGEDGMPVREDDDPASEATFTNLHPDTSEANALGGNSSRVIWGSNISIIDSSAAFKSFLHGYTKKYRMWAEGYTEEETQNLEVAQEREYVNMMLSMLHTGIEQLNLDARNLKAYPATNKLWHQMQAYPQEIIPLMDQTLRQVMIEVAQNEMRERQRTHAATASRARDTSSVPPLPQSDLGSALTPGATPGQVTDDLPDLITQAQEHRWKVTIFGLDKAINMRDLDPADLDRLVSIKGLVIRTTPVIPDMKEAFFKCTVCNQSVLVAIDRGKIAEPTECPRQACKSRDSMAIIHNRCIFADKQVIKLQETPDSVPDGQTPHSVSLCCYDEIVDVCKAGDRIEVTGIFRSNPVRVNPRQRTIKALFKTYVDVLHIQKVDKRKVGIDTSTVEQELAEQVAGAPDQVRKFTATEEAKIKSTAAREDIYDLLSRSLAPSIYELDDVKKGILLQLFGGTNKSFEKGGSPKYRGDVNILLCGDPSTAKSQLLQYVHKIAPRGVYTSGKGSSAVGLTAYVTRDPESKQLVLESGALVLSDGGVCCIDEFDKMNESTRSVLHEVMEQQTVSIAKAGIITTLNARTSLLASANPIGSKYNPNLPVPQNIDLPPTLLSRFDLVYLVLDRIDEVNDRRLAKHVVGMYLEDTPDNATNEEVLPIEFLTSYISYARTNIHPAITPPAAQALTTAYVQMRSLGNSIQASDRRITATTRQLESMIRLSEAHAKMRLSPTVEESDVDEAVRLIKSAIKASATDARTGLIDMGLLSEGGSAADRRRKEDLKRAVLAAVDEDAAVRAGSAVRYADLYRRVGDGSSLEIEGAEFQEALRALEQEGKVQVVGDGARRNVRRITGV